MQDRQYSPENYSSARKWNNEIIDSIEHMYYTVLQMQVGTDRMRKVFTLRRKTGSLRNTENGVCFASKRRVLR